MNRWHFMILRLAFACLVVIMGYLVTNFITKNIMAYYTVGLSIGVIGPMISDFIFFRTK
jgi:hypothetical protein